MWMYLGLLAALFLGLHNLCKKHAVQGNEVFPVLLGTISSGFLFVATLYVLAIFYPNSALENGYNFQQIAWTIH
ncbi:MAG: permease, partial [Polaribacter sp.]|nr:permease [Polaribacter sp.]